MIDDDRIWIAMKYLAGGLFVVILLMLTVPALSDDDHHCQGNSCNDSDGDTIIDVTNNDTNLVSTGRNSLKSKSFGLSGSLGDVDIAQCRESISMSIAVVWQGQTVRLNPWCAAETYDAKGMHKMAAILRCNIDEILEEFDTEAECEAANLYTPLKGLESNGATEEQTGARDEDDDDDDDERYQQLAEQLAAVRFEQQQMQQAPAQVVLDPELKARLDADAQRRAKTREILKGSQE